MARPVGSKNLPKVASFLGKERTDKLTEKGYELAMNGDATMLKFFLEQIYGRAPQPITGEDGDVLQILVKRYGDTDKDNSTPQVPR
jgi:hypothetical protein